MVHWTVFCKVLTVLNNDYAEKAHNVRGRSAISGADLGLVWWHLLCTVWLPILKEYSYTWTSGGLREESLFKAMSCLSPSLLSTLDLPPLAFWRDKIKRQLCIPTPKNDLDTYPPTCGRANLRHSICHGAECWKIKAVWFSVITQTDKLQLTDAGVSEVSNVLGCLYFLQCS